MVILLFGHHWLRSRLNPGSSLGVTLEDHSWWYSGVMQGARHTAHSVVCKICWTLALAPHNSLSYKFVLLLRFKLTYRACGVSTKVSALRELTLVQSPPEVIPEHKAKSKP